MLHKHGGAICVSICLSVCLCFCPSVHLSVRLSFCLSTCISGQSVLQVCAEEHQRYLLFSSLLRHTGSSSMELSQQTALVDLAAAEGRALEGGLASPALVLAVKVGPVATVATLWHQHECGQPRLYA